MQDTDSANLASATVTISAGYVSTEDVLSFTNANGITGSWDSTNGVLALSGSATLATYQAALESVKYQNTNTDNPNTSNRTISWVVNDGTSGSAATTSTISVSAVNDPPTLDNTKSPALSSIAEDAAAASGTTNSTLVSALVSLSGGIANASDVDSASIGIAITAVNLNGGTLKYSTNGGTTWTDVGSVSNSSALLLAADANTRLHFQPAANYNGTISDVLTFKAWDISSGSAANKVDTSSGTAFSTATDTVSIAVAAVNDAPTLTTISTLTGFTEDAFSEITYADLAAAANEADVDGDTLSFRVEAISSGTLQKWDGTAWQAVTAGTTLLSTGEKLQWKAASNANGSGLNAFTVKAWDGTAASSTAVQVKADVTAAPPPPAPADPTPPPPAQLNADLNQNSDTGASNNDRITSDISPNFDINAGNLLSVGQTARLLDPAGVLVSSTPVTAADVSAGKVTIPTKNILDDGTYTYKAQILDATGRVIGESPVTIQIVTDKDGVMPSVELAANGGDYNKDGVQDWEQANVTQLPLFSMADYKLGKSAPQGSFGAVMVGKPDLAAPAGVKLNETAQLVDVKLVDTPVVPLPSKVTAASPMFAFTVEPQDGVALTDSDTTREGLQVQTVISLPKGIKADAFMKFNSATNSWYNYANPSALNGAADGAAFRDTNGDGLVDQIIITVTDGGVGDEDGVVNGRVVDPGMLADTGATVLTSGKDRDGVAADVEMATANHDFNQDGVDDWDQGGIAQLPLASLDAYLMGKDAPLSTFGMLMVGKVDATAPIGARMDTAGQLQNILVDAVGKALPAGYQSSAPVVELQAAPAAGATSLTDIAPTREGLQTQVIEYFATGIKANAYLLFDPISKTWFDYTDANALNGSTDGAALLDLNNDGLIDAVVITLTDNGIGDDDITVNGIVSLHGMLAWHGA